MLFAVTDIETTGGSPSGNAITEIAVVITDGVQIIEKYSSLINPQKNIPHYITVLTGIDNQMIEEAPLFSEVASEIYELFKDKIFVAHNVNFDYSFIKSAFEREGMRFNFNKLCTVRYTRKMFPGLSSYSLGSLCSEFDLPNDNPHRALNDTIMAFELLRNAILKDSDKEELNTFLKKGKGDAFLPMNLKKESFFSLPEESGVYYFRDSTGRIIYIGKAKNIKKRVRQHFSSNAKSAQKQAFFKEIVEIDFELTGTELIAELKENQEIKKTWPKFNRAQKNPKRKFGIFSYEDRTKQIRLAVQNISSTMNPIKSFSSSFKARQWLYDFGELYDIPNQRLGLPLADVESESDSSTEINQRIENALRIVRNERENFIIKGAGRNQDEYSIVLIKDGEYKGYGYLSNDFQITNVESLEDLITFSAHSDYSMSIIRIFIEKNGTSSIVQL